MPLNKERVMLLIEALESGRFKQGRFRLRATMGDSKLFCCLGVACELAVEHGIISPAVYHEEGRYTYDGRTSVLPDKVANWYGFDGRAPSIPFDSEREDDLRRRHSGRVQMISLNDDYGKSFKEIAQALRYALSVEEPPE